MKKILIVDDEPCIANYISDIVQMLGYDVRTLNSGECVVEVAKEWGPDLITLDIMMPPMDGIDVLKDLKNDAGIREIPVFIVSLLAEEPEMKVRLGHAQMIFSKPLDPKQFLTKVRDTLSLN
jgi:CheY-like chemotaxis protein